MERLFSAYALYICNQRIGEFNRLARATVEVDLHLFKVDPLQSCRNNFFRHLLDIEPE